MEDNDMLSELQVPPDTSQSSERSDQAIHDPKFHDPRVLELINQLSEELVKPPFPENGILYHQKMITVIIELERLLKSQNLFSNLELDQLAAYLVCLLAPLMDIKQLQNYSMYEYINAAVRVLRIVQSLLSHMRTYNYGFQSPLQKIDKDMSAHIEAFSRNYANIDVFVNFSIDNQILIAVQAVLVHRKRVQEAEQETDKILLSNIGAVLKALPQRLESSFKDSGCVNLELTNLLASQAYKILEEVTNSELMRKHYWEIVVEHCQDPFGMSVYACLLTWNCLIDCSNPVSQPRTTSLANFSNRRRKKSSIITNMGINEEGRLRLSLIPDPKLAEGRDLISFLEKILEVSCTWSYH